MRGEDWVTAFAPASIGNVGVGFDMLGLALAGVGDRVSVRRRADDGIVVTAVFDTDGAPHPDLSTEAEKNTASIAAAALWRSSALPGGLELVVRKGIPIQSGMGSSAASAVAAVVATNALLEIPYDATELLAFALRGEKVASGGLHADNVAPSLFGGMILCPPALLPKTVRVGLPEGLCSVLVHPDLKVDTAQARRSLADHCTMEQWLTQQGYLASFILACERNDHELIARSLRDVIIEPQRAASVPCFSYVKDAALRAGAMGCSLSGSGPGIFALCDAELAGDIVAAMENACRSGGLACESWVSPMNSPGAEVQTAT
jgi:homoserine kinase